MHERVEGLAREFGRHVRAGGWELGAMVAHCTFTGKASDRANVSEIEAGKTTTTQFAELAGVSQATVNRYRRAWDAAAENGTVPDARTLTPAQLDLDTLNEEELGAWSPWFNQANKLNQAPDPTAPSASATEPAETTESSPETADSEIVKLEKLLTAARAPWRIPDDKLGQAASIINDTIGALEDRVAALDSRLTEIRAAAAAEAKAVKPARVRKPKSKAAAAADRIEAEQAAPEEAELPPGADLAGIDDVFGPDNGNAGVAYLSDASRAG